MELASHLKSSPMAENESKSSDRFTEGIWWRWNLHHEAFPNTYHRDAAVTDPLLETLFSSFISLWFVHLWTAGISFLCSQLPKTTTSRDVLGKQQGESGKVLTAVSPMSLSLSEEKSLFRKWKCSWHLHSEPHTPQCHLLLHFSLRRNASSYNDGHSSRCWNTSVALFGALISVFSTHEQTSKQILIATLKSDICL